MTTTTTTDLTRDAIRAVRAAHKMLAGERIGFASIHALPDGTFAPHDAAMMREYDKVLGMLREAIAEAERVPAPKPMTDDEACVLVCATVLEQGPAARRSLTTALRIVRAVEKYHGI